MDRFELNVGAFDQVREGVGEELQVTSGGASPAHPTGFAAGGAGAAEPH